MASEPIVNFTGGVQAVDNSGTTSTDVSIATTIPNAHTFTGDLTSSGAANFNFSGSSGNFDTTTGNVTLRGNTSVASGKNFTAGAGTTSGTGASSAVNVAVASGLVGGTLLNVDTGTSAFSGSAVNIASSGDFGGTLLKLTADSTTAGTVLGIHTNALTIGAVINADLGASLYTGTAGALRLIANSASSGTLLAISGTTLAANGGTAAQITLGTPGGPANTDGKALSVALGVVGDAYYANAAFGFTGSFARFQVAGVDVLNATATTITTSQSIVASAGSTGNFNFLASSGSFNTSTGLVGLNGTTTLAANKDFVAAAGPSTTKFDLSNAGGTFDTSTGSVTLRGNTSTASGVTFTAGSGILNGVNAVTVATGSLTTGTAVKVDVGASAPGAAVNATQGLGLDVTGTGAFAGLGNNISLAKVSSTGAFTGTLLKLQADNTSSGTVLGISGASIGNGTAIDVALAANYVGTGAVAIHGGQFTGSLLNVSSTADAVNATSSLASLSGALTKGNLLNLAITGTYAGTGALYVDLTGATGAPSGSGIVVNTVGTYTGRFIDLQLAGTSKFNVTPSTVTTTVAFAQTGAVAFSTGTGAVSLNGATTLISSFRQTGANTFSTGTGAVSLNGATTLISSFSQTGANTFSTGTGAVTINGDTTIVNGKTRTCRDQSSTRETCANRARYGRSSLLRSSSLFAARRVIRSIRRLTRRSWRRPAPTASASYSRTRAIKRDITR